MPIHSLDIVAGLLPIALSANCRRRMPFSGPATVSMFPTPWSATAPPSPFSRVLFRRPQMFQGQGQQLRLLRAFRRARQ
jgi:hypothetical protein